MDLDTLLRDTTFAPDPTPQILATGRLALEAAVLASDRAAEPVGRHRPRHSRRFGIAAVLAVAACLTVVIGPTVDVGHRPASQAAATQVLLRAAAAAGAQPGGWPEAAYWHSVSTHTVGPGTYRREIWLGHHGPTVIKDDAYPGVTTMGPAVFNAGARPVTWDELYALSTDSQVLERTLRARIDRAGPDDDSELFTIVGDLLRDSPAPPQLRRALWEVAAEIPGFSLVGPVTDGAGRPGVAVERGTERYVLDPDTGQLLEESSGGPSLTPDSAARTGYRAIYLEQGPANEVPAAMNTGRP